MPPHQTTIVTCIEPGWLASQVLLLAKSLRLCSGPIAETPMLAIQPRRGPAISRRIRTGLEAAGVTLVKRDLAKGHDWYSNFNKSVSMAWAEENCTTPYLTWLDGDIVFLRSDVTLVPPEGTSFIARAGEASLGTNGKDANALYWDEAARITGVDYRASEMIDSIPERKPIYEYYQSGVYTALRTAGISIRHAEFMRGILDARIASRQVGTYHYDQMTLSLAAIASSGKRARFPWEMNYNFNLASKREVDIGFLRKGYFLHYHSSLAPGGEEKLAPYLQHLPEHIQELFRRELPLRRVTNPISLAVNRLHRRRRNRLMADHNENARVI